MPLTAGVIDELAYVSYPMAYVGYRHTDIQTYRHVIDRIHLWLGYVCATADCRLSIDVTAWLSRKAAKITNLFLLPACV